MKTKKKFDSFPLSKQQSIASDPNKNIWVQANAGTGKTEVLNARILRILFRNNLYGTKHPGILCLTYTKVGASEMKTRIVESLRHWVMADDENLKELLGDITENTPTDEDVVRARQIFYSYIDNQDVIKVRTIHSFCTEILNRFSLEAGLGPAVTPIEGVAQKLVLERAFERLLTDNHSDSNNLIIKAIDKILDFQSEDFLPNLYSILAKKYKDFFRITDKKRYRATFSEVLKQKLGIGKINIKKSFRIRMQACMEEAEQLKNTTEDEEVRVVCENIIKNTKLYLDDKIDYPEYTKSYTEIDSKLLSGAKVLNEELIAISTNIKYLRNQDTYDDTMALFDIAMAFAEKYQEIKKEMNVIDYDDMILYTEKLFDDQQTMGYVLSKLDDSLGHILVDEAQDTSAHQWKIFKLLSEGLIPDGEVKNEHSLFAVGDTKQSIYGFQEADPDAFDETKDFIQKLLESKNRSLTDVGLEESFRSSSPILNFVDFFFNDEDVVKQTGFVNNDHKCFFTNRPGIVEFHPKKSYKQGDKTNKNKDYAEFIADEVQRILNTPNHKGDFYRPKDVLVLVRKRINAMAEVINYLNIALKNRNIPVAGADSVVLQKFAPIIDLLDIIRFGINEKDSFALCSILKGPLYRLSEKEIQDLCLTNLQIRNTTNKYSCVFDVLKTFAQGDQRYAEIVQDLKNIISKISYEGPYTFFTHLLQEKKQPTGLDNRQKIISAYGQHVVDPIEEFLSVCLSYERTQPGILKDFLKWFVSSEITIKRDFTAEEGVRIITAHKSKGLTTPVTMLIGTTDPVIVESIMDIKEKELKEKYPEYKFWVWNIYSRQEDMTDELKDIYNKNEYTAIKESFRLLYVALTRSKYDLYIYGKGKNNKNSWYNLLERVFKKIPLAKTNTDIERITKDDCFERFFAESVQKRKCNQNGNSVP